MVQGSRGECAIKKHWRHKKYGVAQCRTIGAMKNIALRNAEQLAQ
jgi:hypothetical protein